jgi:WD40 repeat protein
MHSPGLNAEEELAVGTKIDSANRSVTPLARFGSRVPVLVLSYLAVVGMVLTPLQSSAQESFADPAGVTASVLREHDKLVRGVTFSPDGSRLASVGDDETVLLWDVAAGKVLRTFRGHSARIRCVAFSPDGTRLASASDDGTSKLWSVATGEVQRTFTEPNSVVYTLAFSPDGERLATVDDQFNIKLWDVFSGETFRTFSGHTGQVVSIAFSPDGTRLASASRDYTVRTWDVGSGKMIRTYRGHTDWVRGVAFSPNGTRLASASDDRTLKIWDVATGSVLRTLRGHEGVVHALAFSPNGSRLASASWDRTLKLWDASTGDALLTLRGHQAPVHGVAFSPDDGHLASASGDKTVKIWPLAEPKMTDIPSQPPQISCSAVILEPSGNKALDADETAVLRLKVSNSGSGYARGIKAVISNDASGLNVQGISHLGDLAPGESRLHEIPIKSNRTLANGLASLTISVSDQNGFDAPTFVKRFETRAYKIPRFVVEIGVEDFNNDGVFDLGEQISLKIVVNNQGGLARGVTLDVNGPEGLLWLGKKSGTSVGDIPPGGTRDATFSFVLRNRYSGPPTVPFQVVVGEARVDLGKTLPFTLTLNQAFPRILHIDGEGPGN